MFPPVIPKSPRVLRQDGGRRAAGVPVSARSLPGRVRRLSKQVRTSARMTQKSRRLLVSCIPLACAMGIWVGCVMLPSTFYRTPAGALLPLRIDVKSSRAWVGWTARRLCIEWGDRSLSQFSTPAVRVWALVLFDVTTTSVNLPARTMYVSTLVAVPTWVVFILAALWPLVTILRLRASASAEACVVCGYSLHGLRESSARCPECGEPVPWEPLIEIRGRKQT